jgi:hypothetical protein
MIPSGGPFSGNAEPMGKPPLLVDAIKPLAELALGG